MTETNHRRLSILRIYTKDISFESPGAPETFTRQFQPEIKLNVSTHSRVVEGAVHEVVLELTAEARQGNEVVFIAEVEQAGLFQIEGFGDEEKARCLQVFCPDTLFPYARQVIDQLLTMGSMPPLMLAPLNFEHIRRQRENAARPN